MIEDLEEFTHQYCNELNIELQKIKAKSNKQDIVDKRKVLTYYLYKNTKLSYRDLSCYFGFADHKSIYHYVKDVKNKIEVKDEEIVRLHNIAKKILKNIQ